MKHIISVGISIAVLTGVCRAQDSSHLVGPKIVFEKKEPVMTQVNTSEYYLGKRNKLNSAAWMLLGTGMILSIGGSRQYENEIHSRDRDLNNEIGGAICTVVGTAMVVASVPVFISSESYNRRVMKMSADLKFESYQSPVAVKQYPAIGLRISL